jgi:hypothetical protein
MGWQAEAEAPAPLTPGRSPAAAQKGRPTWRACPTAENAGAD